TRANQLVVFPGPPALKGKLVPVKITAAGTWTIEGELVGFQA
ncbi:MAG TPA: TRAM domain-containing protein, partial [Desulfobacteria bacterium]|nr:TRAM domain-containing protein [Desulfobacteria bacterium]